MFWIFAVLKAHVIQIILVAWLLQRETRQNSVLYQGNIEMGCVMYC
jgi:hypothetical protein